MKHHKANRKLGRERNQRRALLKSLALSLVLRKKMQTTEAKAKEVRPLVEKLITNGKKETLASRRLLISKIGVKGAGIIMKDLVPKYKSRNGGYTRIVKLGRRLKDSAEMAMVEFV